MNGQPHGFFQSTRGLMSGNPLSPTFFIIAAEVLATNLNKQHEDDGFRCYGIPKWSLEINWVFYCHASYPIETDRHL